MAMTLEEVRDRLRSTSPHGLATSVCTQLADAIDAHLTQPAQAVDVVGFITHSADALSRMEMTEAGMLLGIGKHALYASRALAGEQAAPVARPLSEYHEDHGTAVWWAWDAGRGEWIGEPAWIGRPDDSDWPGYHTHYTPHPTFPTSPTPDKDQR